jgi:hypothetical protein
VKRISTWITIIALLVAVPLAARRIAGPMVLREGFASNDPQVVIETYYKARTWGLRQASKSALDPDYLLQQQAPNYVKPIIDDAFLASDLTIEGPADLAAYNTYEDEVQFVVQYTSRWRNEIGQPPGPRHWFVYLGRNGSGPWKVLGEGTGP